MGKPAVRNFGGGRGNEVDGLMTICHDARKGRYTGSHWPKHIRASALLDVSAVSGGAGAASALVADAPVAGGVGHSEGQRGGGSLRSDWRGGGGRICWGSSSGWNGAGVWVGRNFGRSYWSSWTRRRDRA